MSGLATSATALKIATGYTEKWGVKVDTEEKRIIFPLNFKKDYEVDSFLRELEKQVFVKIKRKPFDQIKIDGGLLRGAIWMSGAQGGGVSLGIAHSLWQNDWLLLDEVVKSYAFSSRLKKEWKSMETGITEDEMNERLVLIAPRK